MRSPMPEATPDWSPAQQRMLRAMGYVLWRRVEQSVQPAFSRSDRVTRLTLRSMAGAQVNWVLDGPLPAASAPGRGLLEAVIRAAGCDPTSIEEGARAGEIALALPALAELSESAARKRALWPALRALRRRAAAAAL